MDPFCTAVEALIQKIDSRVFLCISTIWSDWEGLMENTGGQGHNDFDYT